MIFYGTNSSRLKDGQLRNTICPNCENQTTMTYSVFGKYFYLYWIPVFPTGKVNVLECNSCKKTYKLNELPKQIQDKFELEKHTGIPFLHFSGLAIIALIFAYFSYTGSKHKEDEAIYINDPQVGDVYSVKAGSDGYYTTMKITNITNDSIHVVYSDYEIDKKSQTYKVDKSKNYTDANYSYSKKEVLDLYNNQTIFNIDR